MKISLNLIVKGTDDEAQALDKCLGFNASYFNAVYVTITHKKGEKRNREVEKVCQRYGAIISDFEWINDFAAARNFNFAQAPKTIDYIMWCDADDGFRGLETLRDTIEKHPTDAYSMNYLYFFDEFKNPTVVHQKTQIVKNDGCVSWAGALHEDFKTNRNIETKFIKGIERIHLTTEARVNQNKLRNIEVSKAQLEREPDDPRAYWNYGNSLYGADHYEEAEEIFSQFLERSSSDEEKYLVLLKLASIRSNLGDNGVAIEYGQRAIGLRPEYPDAYNMLGQIYYNMNKFQQAVRMLSQGLTKKPPYYSIIVYNPRDYDFHPMMLLAKTFYQLSRPDQSLTCLEACKKMQPKNTVVADMIKVLKTEKKFFDKVVDKIAILEKLSGAEFETAYNKLSQDIKAHPGICALRNTKLIKTESS